MARCSRCNKFMLIASNSSYCKNCEITVKEEARQKAEEERKRLEEEARREAEEERKRLEEEARREAEEEKKRRRREARLKAEEERKRQEEKAEKKRKTELNKLLKEAKQRCKNEQYDDDTVSLLDSALKLATVQSGEWQQVQKLLADVEAKIAERENENNYADALAQFKKANTLPKLKAARDILAQLAKAEYKDSQKVLEECERKIAEQEVITEEKKKREAEARKRRKEEQKRQEEETRRKAEEALRKRQKTVLEAFASFQLRGGIHFGDTAQEVESKEARPAIAPEGDESHLVFPDAVSSVPGGKTYYSFDKNGLLKAMSYTYHSVFQRDSYDMGSTSTGKRTSDILLAGLKKKYGEPDFNGKMILRYIKQIEGAQYQSLFSDADQYSGSSLWKEFGLFSRDDASRAGIKVQNLADMGIRSNTVRISTSEIDGFFGDLGWVIPVDGNFVVIHLVEDRTFRQPHVYINKRMRTDIPRPFWFPSKPGYFVPAGRGIEFDICFMDLVYVRYTESEYSRILKRQKEAEESAARKAEEKEQKLLDEL